MSKLERRVSYGKEFVSKLATTLTNPLRALFLGRNRTSQTEPSKETSSPLETIRLLVDEEIEQLKRGDYAHVICFCCSGSVEGMKHDIVKLAEELDWLVLTPPFADPCHYADNSDDSYCIDIPVLMTMGEGPEWWEYMRNLATSSNVRTPPNFEGKTISLNFIAGFDQKNMYTDPQNGFDRNIRYDSEMVRQLGREMALGAIEEWIHVLQYETQSYLSEKQRNSQEFQWSSPGAGEHDVAFYFLEKGVDIADTVFIKRYNRKEAIEKNYHSKP